MGPYHLNMSHGPVIKIWSLFIYYVSTNLAATYLLSAEVHGAAVGLDKHRAERRDAGIELGQRLLKKCADQAVLFTNPWGYTSGCLGAWVPTHYRGGGQKISPEQKHMQTI
jgi:hypothetical protein